MTTTTTTAPTNNLTDHRHGAFLIDKPIGISSFGIIDTIQRRWREQTGLRKRALPKLGHGGTLDPFATGLLVVCVGDGVKLARYFLGSRKRYEGTLRFGETTIPGDPTEPVSERSGHLPSFDEALAAAAEFTRAPYAQTPPMHSAKKKDGKPLYELARQGIDIEREAKICEIESFVLSDWVLDGPVARCHFEVSCSSGTYIRVLAQDLAKKLGTVGMLDSLRRTGSGSFDIARAWTHERFLEQDPLIEPECFVPFSQMLGDYPRVEIDATAALALQRGQQSILSDILAGRDGERVAIYCERALMAMAVRAENTWTLERVFSRDR
ncbi:MAG: tRNA pseudouridine(55) synthase TruB [Oligoflexia bacterium]|nr:tRNA pseudouridine(55) synthase TruB [Oligoflexia bacterium]